jgi:hypothetical protein
VETWGYRKVGRSALATPETKGLEMTKQQQDELIRLAADVAYFAYRKCAFHCDAQQRDIFRRAHRRVILNCSRQVGKSTTAALIAVHTAYFQPGSTILITACSKQQTREFIRKARTFALFSGLSKKGGALIVEFKNGSRIIGVAANEDTVRSFSAVKLLIIDEASRVKDDVYYALLPVLAVSNGGLWLLSTPKGQRGFFHAEWSDTSNGAIPSTQSHFDPQVAALSSIPETQGPLFAARYKWVKIRVTAHECPRIHPEFLQMQKLRLGERRFAQEYECTFVDTKRGVFHPEATRAAFRDDIKPFNF